jgi:protein-S-isoprenylcysteine O-methyltransferase Ste14
MNTISKFALVFPLAALIFLALSGNLFSPSPVVIAIQVVAAVLGVWARITFHSGQFNIHADPRDGDLLSNGPYRLIRHPMYTMALLIFWSSVVGHPTWIVAGIAMLITAVIAIRIHVEEQLLRLRFSGYAEYAKRTRRVIPFLL